MTEVTKSFAPQRRKENAAISDGIKGKDPLNLGQEHRKLASTIVSLTRLLDPKLAALIFKGVGLTDKPISITDDITLQKDD